MTEMLIDTQKVVDRLTEAGIPPLHAHAHAAVLADVLGSVDAHCTEHYADKDSVARAISNLDARLAAFEAAFRAEFVAVRAEMRSGLDKLRSDLMKWVLAVAATVGILQTALITSLILKLVD